MDEVQLSYIANYIESLIIALIISDFECIHSVQ